MTGKVSRRRTKRKRIPKKVSKAIKDTCTPIRLSNDPPRVTSQLYRSFVVEVEASVTSAEFAGTYQFTRKILDSAISKVLDGVPTGVHVTVKNFKIWCPTADVELILVDQISGRVLQDASRTMGAVAKAGFNIPVHLRPRFATGQSGDDNLFLAKFRDYGLPSATSIMRFVVQSEVLVIIPANSFPSLKAKVKCTYDGHEHTLASFDSSESTLSDDVNMNPSHEAANNIAKTARYVTAHF